MIKISVIMPVYNSGSYLKIAADSILSQSLKDIELILIDDGSTDGSSELCDNYAKRDPRVIVVHKKNGGICNARNMALEIAQGEYIAFSDHDDSYTPGLLEKSYKEAKEYNADVVKFGKRYFHLFEGEVVRTVDNKLPNAVYTREQLADHFFELYREKVLACVWDGIYRKSVIMDNHIRFDESFKNGGEDIAFNMALYPYASIFSFSSEIRYLHYIRNGFSTSSKFKEVLIDDAGRMTLNLLNGMKNIGVDFDANTVGISQLYLYSYVDNIILLMCNPACNYTWNKKKTIMQGFLSSDLKPKDIFQISIASLWKLSKKDTLSFFFLKHKMWILLYGMFKIRVWQKSKTYLNK